MLLAQISDLHIAPPGSEKASLMQTSAFLDRALETIAAQSPRIDALLITGDLVEEGSEPEYRALAERLAGVNVPIFLVAGNHDESGTLRRVMRAEGHDYLPASGKLHYVIDFAELSLIVLDTSVAGQAGGELGEVQRRWLNQTLSDRSNPCIVAQHHPPFRTGIEQMDGMGLVDSANEEEVIGRHSHVERILCGHLHRAMFRRFGGTVASCAPSTAHALELDLRVGGRLGVRREPPAMMLHHYQEKALVSHLAFLGDHGETLVIWE